MLEAFKEPIFVTRPFLPPHKDFSREMERIWHNHQLTNNGPILDDFRNKLSNFLENNKIVLLNNGTLALQIALQSLELTGQVITTPFTFVATSHAILENNLEPVFCDIESDFFNIDPDKIEELINPKTCAILAVHVFGSPCNMIKLDQIAKKHNLKLIYDAAHAFGNRVNDKPISNFGDITMFSFHATKIFHSIEGGMLAFKDLSLKDKAKSLKNFGFLNGTEIIYRGTNAKMNEFQALMGHMMLDYLPQIMEKLEKKYSIYSLLLAKIPGIIQIPKHDKKAVYNHSYMPILIDEEKFGHSRDYLYQELQKYNIFARRYFYPLISDFEYYRKNLPPYHLPNAKKIANMVLTLPLYSELPDEDIVKICEIINLINSKVKL